MAEQTYDPTLHEPVDIVRAIVNAADHGHGFKMRGVFFEPKPDVGSGALDGVWQVCTASEFMHAAHLGIPTREVRVGVPLEAGSQHWFEVLRRVDD